VNEAGETIFTPPQPFTLKATTASRPPPEVRPVESRPLESGGTTEVPKAIEVGDAKFSEVKVDAKGSPHCLCWTADGKGFYLLQGDGVLRQIGLDGFKEEKKMDLERKGGWLAVSAEGVVVTLPDQQEAWVLDVETLKVKAKLSCPSLTRVVSAPGLSVGVAAGRGQSLSVFDLRNGELKKEYSAKDFPGSRLLGFEGPAMTPDGNYVFTRGGIEQIHRFRLTGGELAFEESSQRISQGAIHAGICVSPDSRFVCLPSGGGNYQNLKDHPQAGSYATYVYPVGNVNRPAFVLQQGAYPQAVGFDPKAGLIYTQNHEFAVIVFTFTGVKKKEFKFPVGFIGVEQYLVHPDGKRFLMKTNEKVFLVELTER
jgi:hypothetical protein